MSEVPEGYDLGQELRRKSFEALQYLISRVHSGVLTEEQFNTGVDTLFMAVSGLVPEPITPNESVAAILASPNFSSEEAERHRKGFRAPGEPKFIDVITECQNEIQNIYPVLRVNLFSKADGMFKSFRWQAGDSHVDCTTCKAGEDPTINRLSFDDSAKAKSAFMRLTESGTLRKFGYLELK